MTYTIGYLPQHVNCQGLVPNIFADCWSARSKGPSNNVLGDVMDLRIHNSNIVSGVPVSISVLVGPVRGLFLNEGPHKVMHYHELQVRLVQFIDLVDHFLYHETSMNLSLGQTPVRQDPGDQKYLLAPFAVLPKHQGWHSHQTWTSQCRGNCKGMKQQRIQWVYMGLLNDGNNI